MNKIYTALLFALSLICLIQHSAVQISEASDTATKSVSAKDAHQMMIDGNSRYVNSQATHQHQDSHRRAEVSGGQHPFAAIVSCSDSRVPPEVIFDQGIGDLFVIRLAGNIINDAAIGSIEYAVEHLGVKYVMVLGHESCGAIKASIQGGEAPGHIDSITRAIAPAIASVKEKNANIQAKDLPEACMKANVAMIVQKLKHTEPFLKHMVEKGDLMVVGARYDLDDGQVSIMSE